MKNLKTFENYQEPETLRYIEELIINSYLSLTERQKKLILDVFNKVDLDVRLSLGRTPLILASACSRYKIVELLINLGADLTLTDNKGLNFILAAGRFKLDSIVFYWLNTENAQRLILSKAPSLYKSFLEKSIKIHPYIQKEFAHVITGIDLNLF